MKIVTFNANGIRSAARKGFFEWMADEQPQIVCIQELKAHQDQLSDEQLNPPGYRGYFNCALKKGYSGTAVYSQIAAERVTTELGWDEFDVEGRMVQCDFNTTSVISIYLPSGTSSDERQQFKEKVLQYLKPVLTDFQKQNRKWIICGDLNIAHKPADLRNWKGNRKNSGFLPQERDWMDWLFGNAEFTDAFRIVNSRPGQYSWWSNRGNAYENNVGWRLDYQVVSVNIRHLIRSASIYTDIKFSDHAPVTIDYQLDLNQ